MLANFLKNALEACPARETVTVALFDEPQVRVTVNNPGIIPLEIRDKFLHKFASHGKVGGTGLGGYSARLMAQAMGGTVSFTSDEVTGTTIAIDFAGDVQPASSERSVGDLRALVIDDNEMLLFTIREILRSIGLHKIETLSEIDSAEEYLNRGQPVQLIIIDWNFAAGSCRGLFRRIRADAEYKKIPLLVISSEPVDEEVSAATGEGTVELVSKPFSPDLLLKKVEGFMERMLQLCVKG